MTLHTDIAIKSIADRHGVLNSQIVLTWAVQRGISVVPKSETVERLKSKITASSLMIYEVQNNVPNS